jgi:murein L,D-transpeptidase YcbB/YkuD
MHKINLPELAWTILAVGISSYLVCLGYQTAKSNSISLEVANTKLQATSKLNEARIQSSEVKSYIETIEAQNEAYNQLLTKYENLASTHPGIKKLKPEIEQIRNNSVSSDSITELKSEITKSEAELSNDIKSLISSESDFEGEIE